MSARFELPHGAATTLARLAVRARRQGKREWRRVHQTAQLDVLDGLGLVRVISMRGLFLATVTDAGMAWLAESARARRRKT